MQKWWLGAVGLVAVVLAVLLIGAPDTGDTVEERDIDVPELGGPAPTSDEIVRGRVEPGDDRSPAALPLGEDGLPVAPGSPLASNPKARAVALRREQPEAQWAARTMAPWTQVRREIAKQDSEHPVIEQVQGLIDEIRALRRDPATRDFQTILDQQQTVRAAVESSGLMTGEIESMFALLDQRKASYDAGEYEPEALEAARVEKQ